MIFGRKMVYLNLFVLIIALILGYGNGESGGPPVGQGCAATLCVDMHPAGHGVAAQTGPSPVTVDVCFNGGLEILGKLMLILLFHSLFALEVEHWVHITSAQSNYLCTLLEWSSLLLLITR